MQARLAAVVVAMLALAASAHAQQYSAPDYGPPGGFQGGPAAGPPVGSGYEGPPPGSGYQGPPGAGYDQGPPPGSGDQGAPGAGPPILQAQPQGLQQTGRIFCMQTANFRVADRDNTPERYRPFLGIWSDGAWTPKTCAALIVQSIGPNGRASIVYVYGPPDNMTPGPGGVLHGTGIVRGGMLKFQNSDGSQFSFRPDATDLAGSLTTPQGQTFQSVFKESF
jgi:hypothetical protein